MAVTGPLACGKSTFVRMLGEMGADTVSADGIVHDLLARDPETISKVVERFGEEVRGETGIDRRALARAVFGDERALQDLEDILHPLVREETDRRVAASEADLFVAEIPLLFEGGRSGQFDHTLAVTAPEERRLAWAAERGMGEEQVRAIEARQLPQEEKARRADLVVQNDGDLDTLSGQAREVFEMVTREVGGPGDDKGGGETG
jgi:dephospho-CoA kinase